MAARRAGCCWPSSATDSSPCPTAGCPGWPSWHAALEKRGDGYVPSPGALGRKLQSFLGGIDLPEVLWEATPPWVEPGRQRVDALIPDWTLIVEADGRAWHTRLADFERDRERDALALAHGYGTLRLTWYQLCHRRVWCRNVLMAIGAERSGSRGRESATPAGPSTKLWGPAPRRSGSRGRTAAA